MGLEIVRKRLFHIEHHPVQPGLLAHQAIKNRIDIGRFLDRTVEVGGQPVHALGERDLAYPQQPVMIPGSIVAPQLDLQALQAVLANPVAQQHGIAVVRFRSGKLGRIDRVVAANQVPGWDRLGPGVDQELLGIPTRERDISPVGRLEIIIQVDVHEAHVIGLVGGHLVKHAVGVVHGQVKRRCAHECSEPGNRLGPRALGVIELVEKIGQETLEKPVAQLDRVPGPGRRLDPGLGDSGGQLPQHLVPLLVAEPAGPDPLHGERRLSPALRAAAPGIGNRDANSPQVTSVVISGPNFSGIRVLMGRKYTAAAIGRTSVGLAMA